MNSWLVCGLVKLKPRDLFARSPWGAGVWPAGPLFARSGPLSWASAGLKAQLGLKSAFFFLYDLNSS